MGADGPDFLRTWLWGCTAACLDLVLCCETALVVAQERVATTVAEAERLRNSGQLREAETLLSSYVAAHPADAGAARLLAQTRYWMHDVEGAPSEYERALGRGQHDPLLRLDFARMLMETGDRARGPYSVDVPSKRQSHKSRCHDLLGTLAYWEGDLTTARKLFGEALAANAVQADARRQLREIRAVAAPWVRVSPHHG